MTSTSTSRLPGSRSTKLRDGSASTNGRTYTVNNKKCYHTKAGSSVYAVAWWKDKEYVYVDGLLEHTGSGNKYVLVP